MFTDGLTENIQKKKRIKLLKLSIQDVQTWIICVSSKIFHKKLFQTKRMVVISKFRMD